MVDYPIDLSKHEGNIKIRYKKYLQTVPKWALLQQMFPYDGSEPVGSVYRFAVRRQRSVSCTRKLATESKGKLRQVKNANIEYAIVSPTVYHGRSGSTIAALHRTQGDGAAFIDAAGEMIKELWECGYQNLEVDTQFAGMPVAVVDHVVGNDIFITEATFCTGPFMGAIGDELDIYSNVWVLRAGAGSDDFDDQFYTITAFDETTKKLTVDDATNVQAGDYITLRSQFTANHSPATNTPKPDNGLQKCIFGSGSLFGLTRDSLWRASTVDAGGLQFSYDLVLAVNAQLFQKGFYGKNVALCSPVGWNNAMADLAALRRLQLEDQVKKVVLGAEAIEFYSQTGVTAVKAYPFVQNGIFEVIPEAVDKEDAEEVQGRLVGSTKFTIGNPKGISDLTKSMFFEVIPGEDWVGIKSFADLAFWPGMIKYYGGGYNIVNV